MEVFYVDVKVVGHQEVAVKANSAEEAVTIVCENYDLYQPIASLNGIMVEGSHMMDGEL